MKNNLVIAIAQKLRKEQNPKLKKFGFNVQDVIVYEKGYAKKYGIAKDYVPFSQYSFVADFSGSKKQLMKIQDGEYYDKDSVIVKPTTDIIEIPEDTLLVGFIRNRPHYTVFVPVIGIIDNEDGIACVYDFLSKTFNETFTDVKRTLLMGVNDFESLKKIATNYCESFVVRHPHFFDNEFVTIRKAKDVGVTDFKDWEFKYL